MDTQQEVAVAFHFGTDASIWNDETYVDTNFLGTSELFSCAECSASKYSYNYNKYLVIKCILHSHIIANKTS